MEKQSDIIITPNDEIDSRENISGNKWKNWLKSSAIKDGAGRQALAASMAAPLRRNLDYQGIARRCLVVEQLPSGGASYYSSKPTYDHNRIIISPNDDIGERRLIANRVTVPQFEIFSNPTVRISDIKSRRFDLIDRAVSKARAQIQAQEDVEVFKAIDEAAGLEGRYIYSVETKEDQTDVEIKETEKPKWKSPIRKLINYVKQKICR